MVQDPLIPLVWTDSIAADMIAAEMQEQGIEVSLEQIHSGFIPAPLGRVRVRVYRSRVPSAMTVLEYLRERYPRMPLDFTGAGDFPPFVPG